MTLRSILHCCVFRGLPLIRHILSVTSTTRYIYLHAAGLFCGISWVLCAAKMKGLILRQQKKPPNQVPDALYQSTGIQAKSNSQLYRPCLSVCSDRFRVVYHDHACFMNNNRNTFRVHIVHIYIYIYDLACVQMTSPGFHS